MQATGQTTKNITLGYVARLALIARGHLDPGHVDPPISADDERDLRWRFAEERRSEQAGGGSNFQAMLDRMGLYTTVAKPCRACGGVKEVMGDDGQVLVEAAGGTGTVLGSMEFREYMRIANIAKLRRSPKAYLDRFGGEFWCKPCEGKGWIVRPLKKTGRAPTVQITGQIPTVLAQSKVGGSGSLARLGMIGRKCARVLSVDPIAAAALESYYSPDGGDESALWHLTPTGQRLLGGNTRGLPHQAYFQALRMGQEKNRSEPMAVKFVLADREARQLKQRMARVWHQVNG